MADAAAAAVAVLCRVRNDAIDTLSSFRRSLLIDGKKRSRQLLDSLAAHSDELRDHVVATTIRARHVGEARGALAVYTEQEAAAREALAAPAPAEPAGAEAALRDAQAARCTRLVAMVADARALAGYRVEAFAVSRRHARETRKRVRVLEAELAQVDSGLVAALEQQCRLFTDVLTDLPLNAGALIDALVDSPLAAGAPAPLSDREGAPRAEGDTELGGAPRAEGDAERRLRVLCRERADLLEAAADIDLEALYARCNEAATAVAVLAATVRELEERELELVERAAAARGAVICSEHERGAEAHESRAAAAAAAAVQPPPAAATLRAAQSEHCARLAALGAMQWGETAREFSIELDGVSERAIAARRDLAACEEELKVAEAGLVGAFVCRQRQLMEIFRATPLDDDEAAPPEGGDGRPQRWLSRRGAAAAAAIKRAWRAWRARAPSRPYARALRPLFLWRGRAWVAACALRALAPERRRLRDSPAPATAAPEARAADAIRRCWLAHAKRLFWRHRARLHGAATRIQRLRRDLRFRQLRVAQEEFRAAFEQAQLRAANEPILPAGVDPGAAVAAVLAGGPAGAAIEALLAGGHAAALARYAGPAPPAAPAAA